MSATQCFGVLFRKLVLVVAILVGMPPVTSAQQYPSPPADFPFAVSEPGSTVNGTVTIRESRLYYVELKFNYATEAERLRLKELLGDSSRYPDGRRAAPGVTIPLRVLISRRGAEGKPAYDQQIDTQGTHAHRSAYPGYYARLVSAIVLAPGLYDLRVSTVQATPAIAGAHVGLRVTYDPRLAPTQN